MIRRIKKQKYRKGHCKACGAKLKTEKSLALGFGAKCFDKNSMVILDIKPEGRIVVTRKVIEPMHWIFER